MRLLRTIAVTFSQYSRIPMPRFEWQKEDMRLSMAAFPLVGAVIGLLSCACFTLMDLKSINHVAEAMVLTAIPLIVTGGFHVDGFMDVSDAVSSFRSREDKLRILKDPHIGAFAVIRLAICGLIYLASLIIVLDSESADMAVYVIAAGFVLSRAFSALAVLNLKSAKNEGMLYYEASSASDSRNVNNVIIVIWIILSIFLMIWIDMAAGIAATMAALSSFAWYRYLSYKEFGGITGDTAGYFVTVCETAITAFVAISAYLV